MDMFFAERLKHLRRLKGVSLQNLANKIGVSKTHMWDLEKGKSQNPTINLVVKLADYYETTITDLVEGKPLFSRRYFAAMINRLHSSEDRKLAIAFVELLLTRQRDEK